MFNREERLPAFKLTIVQYAIVRFCSCCFPACGGYKSLERKTTAPWRNKIASVRCPSWRPGQVFRSRGVSWWITIPPSPVSLYANRARPARGFSPIARGLHMTMEQLESTLTITSRAQVSADSA